MKTKIILTVILTLSFSISAFAANVVISDRSTIINGKVVEDEHSVIADGAVVKFEIGNKGYKVNDKYISTDTAAYISNGRTMIPLRTISESLGYEISYNETDGSATIKKDSVNIKFYKDSKTYYVNDRKVSAVGLTEITDSRMYLPIRDVADALGLGTVWDPTNKTVVIIKN